MFAVAPVIMDLALRYIATHPKSGSSRVHYALSSRYPRLVMASADLLVDQSTSTNALRANIRTSANVEKLVYIGGASAFVVFLQNGVVASYLEQQTTLQLVHEQKIGGDGRSVSKAYGNVSGCHALFVKEDSPSLWCLPVKENGMLHEPYKLRSDLEGDQGDVKFVGGVVAKVRGKVATTSKSRTCPIAAIATHPVLPYVAAAYANGIIRVWDTTKREQRNHFDAQLLLSEKIVDIVLHPDLPVVVLCTTLGRILTFRIKSGLYRRGDEPALPSSKTRDRKRHFRAMCCMMGSPSYLLLLTASRRIMVRMITKGSMIVSSSRFTKLSKVLAVHGNSLFSSQNAAGAESSGDRRLSDSSPATVCCEPTFGLMACALDRSGSVYIFQPKVDGMSGIRRPLTTGLDSGFSTLQGKSITGPVHVDAESLIVYGNTLFGYQLGTEELTKLCVLPPGDMRRVEVARDGFGFCVAAVVFYYGDEEVNSNMYAEADPPARYVLCTRRGTSEPWNASEPAEGRSGCFLNAPGHHDRVLILSSSGTTLSLFSFGRTGQSSRQTRGVQRVKLQGNRVSQVFNTPFANWTAILMYDIEEKRLAISKNAFGTHNLSGTGEPPGALFEMDKGTSIKLQDSEIVIDVRWQRKFSSEAEAQYLGAIMTDKRIYFVHRIMMVITTFEFQSIARMVVPFVPPTVSWVGPSLMLLYGNSLFSISLDGNADLIAGVSRGEHVTALVASLRDRVIFARSPSAQDAPSVSVASRQYSGLSGLIRGMLSLPKSRSEVRKDVSAGVKEILDSCDSSQGSWELTDSLIRNNMSAIAYLIAVSDKGKYSIPPLKRAAFLGRLGDIRGALLIVEEEYSRLPDAQAFHKGTELYRLLQRVMNMAFSCGEFGVGEKCSALLGKRGTFSAFVDREGGYTAARSVMNHSQESGDKYLLDVMRSHIEKSSRSCIATDSSVVASPRDIENMRRTIESLKPGAISLGSEDKVKISISIPPGEDEHGNVTPASRKQLDGITPTDICSRLGLLRRDTAIAYANTEMYPTLNESEDFMVASETRPVIVKTFDMEELGARHGGSSDEDELFKTGPEHRKGLNETDQTGSPAFDDSASRWIKPGDLSDVAQRETAETRKKLALGKESSSAILKANKDETHALLVSQHSATDASAPVSGTRAIEIRERALRKYGQGKLSSAQKELDSSLRALSRGTERGVAPTKELLYSIVHYQMACRIRIAMDEIASSVHANTSPGRITYAQLANALTTLPLDTPHRVDALALAVDGNLVISNFGVAAHGLRLIKELGVPEDMRLSLRDKYEICQARGFANTLQQPAIPLCFLSLKGIGVGGTLSCPVCPAVFALDIGVSAETLCPCCGFGKISLT